MALPAIEAMLHDCDGGGDSDMFAGMIDYETSLFFKSHLSHWRLGTEEGWRFSQGFWLLGTSSSLRFFNKIFPNRCS
jgi:hypothetical protein